MQLRVITPEEMAAINELAAESSDLRQVLPELRQLRALRATLTAPAPLRPASFRELLKGVDVDLLSLAEARAYMGLEPRLGTLERAWRWVTRPLQVVASALTGLLTVSQVAR
jgi:hypothetical protein